MAVLQLLTLSRSIAISALMRVEFSTLRVEHLVPTRMQFKHKNVIAEFN